MALLVLDAETKKTFQEVGGKAQTSALGISVVGVYNYADDSLRAYTEDEMSELEQLIMHSSGVVGFNIIGFDWPVMQPYFKNVKLADVPTIDIMVDLQQELGYRVRLEAVAQGTVGAGKSGDGLDAIKYYREGNMEALIKYCLDDVKVTRDVYDRGVEDNQVWFKGWEKYPVPVSWKPGK